MQTKANRVLRPDGRFINVPRHRGQLFVCATGCCCGDVGRGYAPVHTDVFHEEWERRKLRNKIHLSQGGCLGPCPLANVVTLFFDGKFTGFQGVDDPKQIVAIFDYLEELLANTDSSRVQVPSLLKDRTFDYFTWSNLHAEPDHLSLPVFDMPMAGQPGILFLTQADTDLLSLDSIRSRLPDDFPPIHAHNMDRLGTPAQVEATLNQELARTQVVVARLHGGRASFREGLEHLVNVCKAQNKDLICISGIADFDPELTALSNVPLPVIHDVYNYLTLGGLSNFENLFRYLADNLMMCGFGYDLPAEQPQHGIYLPQEIKPLSVQGWMDSYYDASRPTATILFYRSHWLSGNLEFVDALCESLSKRGFNVLPVFAYSLKEGTGHARPAVFDYFYDNSGRRLPDVLICSMSFALGSALLSGPTLNEWDAGTLQTLGIPILQVINSGMERDQWELSARGLAPLDTAMNVALPEFDGRIITVPISFKKSLDASGDGKNSEARYIPVPDRIERVAGLALRFANLQRKPNHKKRVAVVLTNQPGRAACIGNAVGLDTPASLLHLFGRLGEAGYFVENVPTDGDTLIHNLIDRCSYDRDYLMDFQLTQAIGSVPVSQYADWFNAFPERNRTQMSARWQEAPGTAFIHDDAVKFAGLEFGNILVALQPPRGFGMDPQAIYHTPDLPPPHHYAAFYRWLSEPHENGGWGADVILHMGKHGTLEWLPGKGVGVSETCFPDLFLANMPLVYPFIINDPGEGMQAKRRAHAVIVDHLTPPMTTADSYGELEELRQLVDEYYQLEALDPAKLPLLQSQIWELIKRAHLDEDLQLITKRQSFGAGQPLTSASHVHAGINILKPQKAGSHTHTHEWDATETEDGTPVSLAEMKGKDFAHFMEDLDGYLCELTSAQIRDGLYTIGAPLQGDVLTDLLVALTRLPNLEIPSLRDSVAAALGFDLKSLLDTPGSRLIELPDRSFPRTFVTHSDAIEFIDETCRNLVSLLNGRDFHFVELPDSDVNTPNVRQVLSFICETLVPDLRLSQQEEVSQTLNALGGGYVPPGASGAPTRGMAHVLPTGRNFYSVDPRSLPSQTSWRVGQALADELLNRYLDTEGGYPETVGLSIWGTSAMRTHGDDIAQCFALLGVRPRWQAENRRLLDVEVIPLEELKRPRIDVLMRISGFFRDAFPHLIQLMDRAVQSVAALDEPLDQNFVRKHVLADLEKDSSEEAQRKASYRIFGSKPGSYGAGILPLIDERNWKDSNDFAEAYINWGGYAYGENDYGADMRPVFSQRLASVQVAAKNQDNREHDIFDSDDYLQYHGGMIAAIRALSGKTPVRFFGDSSDPARVKVRDLSEETKRVFRSRVVNPKWLESIQRHGYKGGLELAATVDYLFGYDATAEVLDDWMYEQVAEKYAFDEIMQKFLRQSNPWALRDIVSRLLEAAQREMWNADEETLKRLRELYAEIGGDLEDRMDRAWLKSAAAQKGEVIAKVGSSIDMAEKNDTPQVSNKR